MTDDGDRLPKLIRSIYALVDELERLAPGRKFTPDGHMVGSLGEVWAAYLYGLTLLASSSPPHDAQAPDRRLVQVKTTQGDSVSTYPDQPQHILVLRLLRNGTVEECFNGPGSVAWTVLGKKSEKNGQCRLRLTALRRLNGALGSEQRLPTSVR